MASATDLERGNYFLLRGEPVKVIKKELINVGSHSHTKIKFFIEYLFSGKQDVVVLAHQDTVEILDIMKKKATLISKNPLQIMDLVSYETKDAEAEQELIDTLNEGDEIIYVDYNNKVKVLEKVR